MSIEIINNKARHNLIDAKCRWCSDRLDGAGSFWELLGANQPEGDTNPPAQLLKTVLDENSCWMNANGCHFFNLLSFSSSDYYLIRLRLKIKI